MQTFSHDVIATHHSGDNSGVRKTGDQIHGAVGIGGAVDPDDDTSEPDHRSPDDQDRPSSLLHNCARHAALEEASERAVATPADDKHVGLQPARLTEDAIDSLALDRHHIRLRPSLSQGRPGTAGDAIGCVGEGLSHLRRGAADPLRAGDDHAAHAASAGPWKCPCGGDRPAGRRRAIRRNEHAQARVPLTRASLHR
jgi:hypothetical protein